MSLDLGGYGMYVWPAYGLAAVVLLGLLAASLRALLCTERALGDLQASQMHDGRGGGG